MSKSRGNSRFLGIWMAITHWAEVNSLMPNKNIPTRNRGLNKSGYGTPLQWVEGMPGCVQSSDGQLYRRNGKGTLYRINPDGSFQKRRGN